MKEFEFRNESQHQTYGIGLKELWEVKPENSKTGNVMHSIGWPLTKKLMVGLFYTI